VQEVARLSRRYADDPRDFGNVASGTVAYRYDDALWFGEGSERGR
jgi:hypothetical protein